MIFKAYKTITDQFWKSSGDKRIVSVKFWNQGEKYA